jgi:hypothetical protein
MSGKYEKKAKRHLDMQAPNWLAELLKTQGNEQDCGGNWTLKAA